jgi:lambda family phage portal protein
MIVDGEVLLRIVKKKVGKSPVGLCLEIIEADQLDDRDTDRIAYNGNRIFMGVEVDEWGGPVAYHLLPYHPGDYQFTNRTYQSSTRVPANEIIHLYVSERPGQMRGVPWLHNVIDRIKNISGYEEAEIIRSRVQSCAVGAITSPEPDAMTDTTDADSSDYKFLSPGEILRLAPGEEFTMGNAAAPNPSLESFIRSIARSIAAGIGVSYESLTRDFSNTSYSSARTALLAERDLYEVIQSEFIESFLCPFYIDHWLPAAAMTVPGLGYYSGNEEFHEKHRWTRRGWPWVDPLKDLQASELALNLNLTTLTRELATQGIDIEDLLKERAAEKELLKQYGLGDEEQPTEEGAAAAPEEEENVPIMPGLTPIDGGIAVTEPAPVEPTPVEAAPRELETAITALSRAVEVMAEVVKTRPSDSRIPQELLDSLRELKRERQEDKIEINLNLPEELAQALQTDVAGPEPVEERSYEPIRYLIYEGLTPLGDLALRGATKGKTCKTGQACGNTCIAPSKTCKLKLQGSQKEKAKNAKAKTNRGVTSDSRKPNTKLAGTIGEIDPATIEVDPKRFQYKIIGEHTQSGEVGSLSGVQKYDPQLAGILQVWQDPSDGKTYVVNGHNRLALAKRAGAERVAVRYLDVQNDKEARAVGALTNIAEGRGTAEDAAKFFKDTGLSAEDIRKKGIPMREKIATDGLALSNLDDVIFKKVIDGDIPTARAVIIGKSNLDKDQQKSLVELIDKQPKSKKITDEVLSELVDTVAASSKTSSFQMDLFGGSTTVQTNAIERAKAQAAIRKKMSTDKNLFGTVSKTKAAQSLAQAGNVIDVLGSKQISQDASVALNVFDKLKNVSGPVSDSINKAVERISNGEPQRKVYDDLYKEVTEYAKSNIK